MKKWNLKIRLCTLFALFAISLFAQNEPVSIGEKISMTSTILSEERPIWIYTPEDYDKDVDKKYPVAYLLDGDDNFFHTTSSIDYLGRTGRIPEMIVVAIPNTSGNRTRDLTPLPKSDEAIEQFPTAGGADNLLRFMTEELMPHIKTNYRTEDYKMLIGHSFGGLFAIHSLINHPEIFNSYLSISPSLWWDEQDLVLHQSDTFFQKQKDLKGHLYVTMANEGGTMIGGMYKLVALLEEKGSDQFHVDFKHLPDENHGSVPFMSTIHGLEFIFKEWTMFGKKDEMNAGGIKAIKEFKNQVDQLYGIKAPIDAKSLKEMGQEFMNDQKWSDVIELFEMMSDMGIENADMWTRRGFAHEQKGNSKKAIEAFKEALVKNPEDRFAMNRLTNLGIEVSAPKSDFVWEKTAIEKIKGDYSAQGLLIRIYEEDGKIMAIENPDTDGTKVELYPTGSLSLFYLRRNAHLSFKEENGLITGVEANVEGQKFNVPKIK